MSNEKNESRRRQGTMADGDVKNVTPDYYPESIYDKIIDDRPSVLYCGRTRFIKSGVPHEYYCGRQILAAPAAE